MDAVTYIKAYARMCDSFDSKHNITGKPCVGCPLDDIGRGCHMNDLTNNAEECVAAVEKWAKEHPARTRQSELLKLFPEVISDPDGFIDICPALIVSAKRKTKTGGCRYPSISCEECKREFWLAEIKDGET